MVMGLRIAVYHNLHSGGAKHALYQIVRRLIGRHQVDHWCISTADTQFYDLREFVEDNLVFEFKPGRLFHSPFGRFNQAVRWCDLARLEKVQRCIAAEIDRRGYDVAYIQPCQFTQNPSLLCYLRTPSLYHCQEPFRRFYELPLPRVDRNNRGWRSVPDRIDPFNWAYHQRLQRWERRNVQHASRIVTNSFFTREALYRIYGVNARVLYLGVDPETFRPLGLPKENMVLSVGALIPQKGFDFIVESLGLIPKHLQPNLVVVSNYQEPAERAYLEKLAAARGVSLRLCVQVSTVELVHLYNTAICTVYAPIMEPFGLVPLESMACGTPVVAVKEGGVRESVLHGQTGLLTDRDADQFAIAARTLLENEVLAKQYGEQARKYVLEHWSWDVTVQQLEQHLLQVADRDVEK